MNDKEITAMKAVLFLAQRNPRLKRDGIWVEDINHFNTCHKIRFEEALSIATNMLYGSGTETEESHD